VSVSETIIRRQEAAACERADKAEEKVIQLTKKFGKLVREKGEICISPRLKFGFPQSNGWRNGEA
jgi:hypothetical protein